MQPFDWLNDYPYMYAVIALGFITIVVGFVYFFLSVNDKKTKEEATSELNEKEPLVEPKDVKKELIYAQLPAEREPSQKEPIIYEKLPPLQNVYGKLPASRKEERVYGNLPVAPVVQKVIYDKLPDVSDKAKEYYAKKIPAKLGVVN